MLFQRRKRQSNRLACRRPLRIESLESRTLLAADFTSGSLACDDVLLGSEVVAEMVQMVDSTIQFQTANDNWSELVAHEVTHVEQTTNADTGSDDDQSPEDIADNSNDSIPQTDGEQRSASVGPIRINAQANATAGAEASARPRVRFENGKLQFEVDSGLPVSDGQASSKSDRLKFGGGKSLELGENGKADSQSSASATGQVELDSADFTKGRNANSSPNATTEADSSTDSTDGATQTNHQTAQETDDTPSDEDLLLFDEVIGQANDAEYRDQSREQGQPVRVAADINGTSVTRVYYPAGHSHTFFTPQNRSGDGLNGSIDDSSDQTSLPPAPTAQQNKSFANLAMTSRLPFVYSFQHAGYQFNRTYFPTGQIYTVNTSLTGASATTANSNGDGGGNSQRQTSSIRVQIFHTATSNGFSVLVVARDPNGQTSVVASGAAFGPGFAGFGILLSTPYATVAGGGFGIGHGNTGISLTAGGGASNQNFSTGFDTEVGNPEVAQVGTSLHLGTDRVGATATATVGGRKFPFGLDTENGLSLGLFQVGPGGFHIPFLDD